MTTEHVPQDQIDRQYKLICDAYRAGLVRGLHAGAERMEFWASSISIGRLAMQQHLAGEAARLRRMAEEVEVE